MYTSLEATSRQPGLDRISLPVIVLLSMGGYVLLGVWFPLLGQVTHLTAGDIRTFAPSLVGGVFYGLLLAGLFLLLVLAFERVSRIGLRDLVKVPALARHPLLFLLATTLLYAAPLVFAYPINSVDLLNYVVRGRIVVLHGGNPYLSPPASFAHDPLTGLLGEWAGETSPYGPLWEAAGAAATTISGDSYLSNLVLLKLLCLACFLGGTVLIWSLLGHAASEPEDRRRVAYTLLWAWNPALLLTFVVDGHNDALMLFWLLLGLWLGRRRQYTAAVLAIVLAVLTKPAALLALPFFVLGFWREVYGHEARLRFVMGSLAGSALLTGLAFLPWASPSGYFRTPVELALRLSREATASAGFSPATWVYFASQALGFDVSIETIGHIARIMFAALAVWLLWQAWRGRSPLRGAADIFCGYLLTALSFRIWYATWPFPWLLLDVASAQRQTHARDGLYVNQAAYRLRVGLWFLLTTQLSVILYGHLRVYLLSGRHSIAHLLGVPLVFLLPWILGRVTMKLPRKTSRSLAT